MKKCILIADDDPAVLQSLRKLLEGAGYEVTCATDGDEAEAKIAAEAIDLLILDLGLPKQNGWNVFGLASALRPLLPIIILTGLKEQSGNALLPGVAALLEKPVDVIVLAEGQWEEDIEVLKIEPKAGSVQVSNGGTLITLTFEKNGRKPAPEGAPRRPMIPTRPFALRTAAR